MRFGLFLNVGELPGQQDHDEVLARAIAYTEAAERLGFRDVWVTEHHFIPFGICPSALTLAGFLLGRTRTLRVGTAVSLVHLYHPLQLAEQVALLDQASGGRLDFGIGRGGYLHEVAAFSSVDRWEADVEATLDVLLPAWTKETVRSDNLTWAFEAGNHPAVQSGAGGGHGDRAALAAGIVEAGAVGPPALCIERLATTLERTGARHLTLLVEAAGDPDRTLENIERLATEVFPAVARQVGATEIATRTATAAVPADG